MPAVLPGRGTTHPHLHDRMRSAGVQPSYPRPLPPPRHVLERVLHLAAAVAMLVAFVAASNRWRGWVYDSGYAAIRSLVVSGGDHEAVGTLGYHWMERDPQAARTLLMFAAERSTWPEYSLRLAMLLAPEDPAAARRWLQRAESDNGSWDIDAQWLAEFVAVVREAIGADERR